jgi:hypothetical protein
VLETVRALEALGYREGDLHLLAEQLAGQGAPIRPQGSGSQDSDVSPDP